MASSVTVPSKAAMGGHAFIVADKLVEVATAAKADLGQVDHVRRGRIADVERQRLIVAAQKILIEYHGLSPFALSSEPFQK